MYVCMCVRVYTFLESLDDLQRYGWMEVMEADGSSAKHGHQGRAHLQLNLLEELVLPGQHESVRYHKTFSGSRTNHSM